METTETDYNAIPKIRRLAIFFTVIGPENSAEILQSFEDAEVEAIAQEIIDLDLIDDDLQRQVLEEFSSLLLDSASSVKGGYDIAIKTVENARGPIKARSLASKLGPPTRSNLFEEFSQLGARQLWNMLKDEQSQTIAFILSGLETEKAVEILDFMEDEMRSEVVVGMGIQNPTTARVMEKVVKNLSLQTEGRMPPPVSQLGGEEHLASVMKQLDSGVSKGLLSDIEAADAQLGARISKEMFSFRDLVKLSQEAMQRIMREVDTQTMVMAMKSAEPELCDMIYASLSKRGAEALREELELLGRVKIKEVDAAQEVVLQSVRQLEEDGEISFDESGEDQYV